MTTTKRITLAHRPTGLPDDDTWTWEDLTTVAKQITTNTKEKHHGISGTIGGSVGLEMVANALSEGPGTT